MTDLYAMCPCGSGKKIKFCCKDIFGEIEKIELMLRGEQRTAALEKIDKLLEKHPGRAVLLTMKATVLLEQDQKDEAFETVDILLETNPNNSSGHALRAMMLASNGQFREALIHLHRGMRLSENVISQTLYRACLTLCVGLMRAEQVVPAYAHLMLLVSMSHGQDQTATSLLMQLASKENFPTIFLGLNIDTDAPEAASWKREFDLAIDLHRSCDWSEAADRFRDMNRRILDEPILLRNQAILDVWTCRNESAIKAFRNFASIREVDMHEAVEAEACAQVLDKPEQSDYLDLVRIENEIDDANSVMEKLLSVDRAKSVPAERLSEAEYDGPPAKRCVHDL